MEYACRVLAVNHFDRIMKVLGFSRGHDVIKNSTFIDISALTITKYTELNDTYTVESLLISDNRNTVFYR